MALAVCLNVRVYADANDCIMLPSVSTCQHTLSHYGLMLRSSADVGLPTSILAKLALFGKLLHGLYNERAAAEASLVQTTPNHRPMRLKDASTCSQKLVAKVACNKDLSGRKD